MDTTTGTTQLGTPHAGSWDSDWSQVVEAEETRLQRRICGARGYGGKACLMEPASANGRCRFHGGFAGAPKGNRNALRHGLYSRRLQACGPTCAAYGSCPVAVTESERELLPEPPLCPFETEELKDALRDAGVPVDEDEVGTHSWHGSPTNDGRDALPRVRSAGSPTRPTEDPNSWPELPTHETAGSDQADQVETPSWQGSPTRGSDGPDQSGTDARSRLRRDTRAGDPCHDYSAHHNDPPDPERGIGYEVALLRVMLGRAAVAIAHHGLADETVATGREYEMRYRKSSAFLDAFVRLSREYRLLHRMQSVEREEAAKADAETWFANALRPPPEGDEDSEEDEIDDIEEVGAGEDR